MSRPCPNCGAAVAPEARFCRLCGTPLKAAVAGDTPVSPSAQTVPLSDEGRTTHGLGADGGGTAGPNTHRVGRAEMDSLLRHAPQPSAPQNMNGERAPHDGDMYAAPATSQLPIQTDGDSTDGSAPRASKDEQRATGASLHEGADVGSARERAEKKKAARGAASGQTRSSSGARRTWQLVAVSLLGIAIGAAGLALYYSRRTAREETSGSPPISINDQKRLVEEKLAEAERLLASGNTTEATARLRYVVRLDPSNARAHRLLAEALDRNGSVTEAVDEYRVAAQLDGSDEQTWLLYADALRRVGRVDEARDIYQRLSSSSAGEVARTAREQLTKLPPAAQTSAANVAARGGASAESNGTGENETTAPAPPQSTVAQNVSPSQAPGTNAADTSQPSADASYNEAMRIIQGRDIKKMSRAELLRAYELFQRAQAGGSNSAEASRRVRQLDTELFERRKRGQ